MWRFGLIVMITYNDLKVRRKISKRLLSIIAYYYFCHIPFLIMLNKEFCII